MGASCPDSRFDDIDKFIFCIVMLETECQARVLKKCVSIYAWESKALLMLSLLV